MIIRTSMAERAAAGSPVAVPRLSQRELRRLEYTGHRKKVEEEAPVVEEVREESAVAAQPIQEPDNVIVEPGTAKIRSKVLEEIENSYKKEPDAVPKKKYKVISIG